MVWYIFPIQQKISWEGHLSGFLIGFAVAYIYKNKGPKPKQFVFTKNDEFDSLFDDEGNYNPPPEEVFEEDIK
ncbi:rhomboid family intramembrane serine protease [Lutibacter profundi]|uniref:rhomboid family intramembrane serine protease n=1 Tax=Lutibacter profundi TaxID=1622118 RepID=UPI001F3D46C7|nr:rhomboid family intramembrane serine protease [Lutibacter profundi]